jgi:hypothetical protein
MYQRNDDPMTNPEPPATTRDPHRTQSGGLSTADLAGTNPAPVEREIVTIEPANVTPIGSRREQPPQTTNTPPTRESEPEGHSALFRPDDAERFRTRWTDVQTGFVDEPRHAVEQADGLVAETIKRLAEVFAEERSQLETQWSRGEDVSTEDLRLALRRYRSFFDRLLSV